MENSDQTEEQAAIWLLKRDSADWSEDDQRALDQWLESATANTVAYLRLEAAWQQTRRLKAFGGGINKGSVPSPEDWQLGPFFDERPGVQKRKGFKASRALVAGVLLAIVGSAASYLFWSPRLAYQTAVGATAAIPMSDGSKVTLNTNTKLRVAVTERQRSVRLERGEAFFEVAKDPTRPFVVTAGDKRVIAVGTKFSVDLEGREVRVVVSEGTVRMEDATLLSRADSRASGAKGAKLDADEARNKSGQPPDLSGAAVLLPAGSVARAEGDSVLVQEKPLPDVIEEYLSWRTGYLVFHDVALKDAISDFNRYNTRKIVISDEGVAAIKVSGKFRSTNLDAFIRLLQDGFAIRARNSEDQILLTSR